VYIAGIQDTSTNQVSKSTNQFTCANELPAPSQTVGPKSPTLQRHNISALSSLPASQFSPVTGKYLATENSLSGMNNKPGSVPINEAKSMLQSETNRHQKPLIPTMLSTQAPSLPKKSSGISDSSSKETMVTSYIIGTTKDKALTTKNSLFESEEKHDSPSSSTFDVPAAPSLSRKVQLDAPVGRSQPGENVLLSPIFPVSVSAPSSPMINSMTAPPSSLFTTTVPTSSSSVQLSRSFTTSNSSADPNQAVSTSSSSTSTSPIAPSGSFSLEASKTLARSNTPLASNSEYPKTEPPMAKFSSETDTDASTQAPPVQSEAPKGEVKSKLEASRIAGPTVDISTSLASGSQPSFSNMANPTLNVSLNAQPEQPSAARVLFPTPLSTSGSAAGEKNESLDVAVTEEDEMEEEASETSNTAELNLRSLGGFGIGSAPNPAAPKSNPFGGPFGNAVSSPMSSAFNMTIPSGELFRPASFSFQSPHSSQPSQPMSSTAFSGGFGTGINVQAPTQTGFGQPAQIGSGQQALGSVLGAFGQSRQLGTGLPGAGFVSPSGFGGGFPGTSSSGGFSNASPGGGFAGVASPAGGFAGLASASGGFAGATSGVGGFAGMASAGGGSGGTALAVGGFPVAGSILSILFYMVLM
jgi:nuclear pore complex protein Nup214